jgi:ketosteroid isomerase-like protein
LMSKRFVLAAASLCVLALAAALSAGSAQTGTAKLPPLPSGEKNFPKALAPVVMAEHAFAEHSIAHGMKEAFLNFAAPDGVIFRRGPVNAIEAWTRTNPAPPGLLTWWPVYADVSGAGDLGYTTGPYEFRDKPTDEKPSGTGHYFTVWRRQPDGSWKFAVDLGIQHEAPPAPETVLRYPAWVGKGKAGSHATAGAESAGRGLSEAEVKLSEESSEKGMTTALLARADETLRLYRQNSLPVVGREAARMTLKTMTEFVAWKALKTEVAASGDMGYAYGTYELKKSASDAKPAEQGNYARVWRRQGGGPWRVVFQVTSPVRQPSQ